MCKQGRALGFDGKSLIHPKTVSTTPSHSAPCPPIYSLGHKWWCLCFDAYDPRATVKVEQYTHERTGHAYTILTFPPVFVF